jgi:hypothetical protein
MIGINLILPDEIRETEPIALEISTAGTDVIATPTEHPHREKTGTAARNPQRLNHRPHQQEEARR